MQTFYKFVMECFVGLQDFLKVCIYVVRLYLDGPPAQQNQALHPALQAAGQFIWAPACWPEAVAQALWFATRTLPIF
jgi:hypothetical protein